jgi:hypothetical protein
LPAGSTWETLDSIVAFNAALKKKLMKNTRRFPPLWSIEELEACFTIRDHSSQALAYVS